MSEEVYASVADAMTSGKEFPLSYVNASLWFKFNGVLMQEPVTVFQKMQGFFEGRTVTIDMPSDSIFKPEYLSKRLYGTPDLWWLLLVLNKCKSHKEFNRTTVTVLNPDFIDEMNSFLNNISPTIAKNREAAKTIEDNDLTIKEVIL